MTSPTTLVVRMRSDTDGPNRFPGKSRLTLFRSKVGIGSSVVEEEACRAARGPGAPRPLRRPAHVLPLCRQLISHSLPSPQRARRASRLAPRPLSLCNQSVPTNYSPASLTDDNKSNNIKQISQILTDRGNRFKRRFTITTFVPSCHHVAVAA